MIDNKRIKLIENFFNNEQCLDYISYINRLELENPKRFNYNIENFNFKIKNDEIPSLIWHNFKKYCSDSNLNAICNHDYVYGAHYMTEQNFILHTDTGAHYDRKNGTCSTYTVLIYLNDNYEGGELVFYDDFGNITKTINPAKGLCVIFDIKLYHCAKKVIGEKYWIGCEFIGKIKDS